MLNPNLDEILNGGARYSLVIATAKRAREIVNEAIENENEEVITEKPVTLALNEFLRGERKIKSGK